MIAFDCHIVHGGHIDMLVFMLDFYVHVELLVRKCVIIIYIKIHKKLGMHPIWILNVVIELDIWDGKNIATVMYDDNTIEEREERLIRIKKTFVFISRLAMVLTFERKRNKRDEKISKKRRIIFRYKRDF